MSGFDLNSATISGNLTGDPELRSLPSGTSVCNIRIGHNDRRKDSASGEYHDVPGFYDVTVWGGLGEWLSRNVTKGDKVIVAGRLMWREYETQDGSKRQAVSITAQSVIPVPRSDTAEPAGDFEPANGNEDIPF